MAKFKSALEEKLERARNRGAEERVVKGVGGQLTSQTPTSLSQAAGFQGLQTPPTTPLGAQNLGVSVDAAKMAGTPNQLASATRQTLAPETKTLADSQRQGQVRQELTEEEKAKREKSDNLKSLGGLGDRVHSIISSNFSDLATAPAVSITGAEGQEPSSDLISAVNLPLDDPNRQQLINEAIAKFANQNGKLDLTALKDLFPDSPETVLGLALQSALPNEIEVNDTFFSLDPSLGFSSLQDFQDKTGVVLPEGATLQDLQNKIQETLDVEFQETNRLQGILNSPGASPQERQAARQALIDMGALELASDEMAAHEINKQVQAADEIKIGDNTVSVGDLLKDESISQLAKDYYENPESEESKELAALFPELKTYLDSNKELLEGLTKSLGTGVEEIEKNQEDLRDSAKIPDLNLTLSDDFLKNILGVDPTQFSADPQSVQIPKIFTDPKISTEKRTYLVGTLEGLSKTNPALAQQLLKRNYAELDKLQAFTPNGILDRWLKRGSYDADPKDKFLFSDLTNIGKLENADLSGREAAYNMSTALGYKPASNKVPSPTERQLFNKYQNLFKDGNLGDEEVASIKGGDLATLMSMTPNANIKKSLQNKIYEDQTSWLETRFTKGSLPALKDIASTYNFTVDKIRKQSKITFDSTGRGYLKDGKPISTAAYKKEMNKQAKAYLSVLNDKVKAVESQLALYGYKESSPGIKKYLAELIKAKRAAETSYLKLQRLRYF